MAETAAHLVEHVFPRVPVRQWAVTFPRRLGYDQRSGAPFHFTVALCSPER